MKEVKEEKKTTGKNNNKNSSNNKKSNNNYKTNNSKNNGSKKSNQSSKNNNIKKKEEDIEILDKTNSFDIIIDEGRLKDKESLDFSFIDGKRKKKKAKEEIEILEETIDYKEEAKKIELVEKPSKKSDFVSTTLIILFSFVLGFLICFIWSKESGYFTTIEKVTEEVIKEKVVVDDNFVFVGDSLFERYDLNKYYPNMPVINSGISGNKTIDILNNMNERIYRYNPSKVVLLIGTNDYNSISNDDTVENIGKIIEGIKENRPHAEIYVQSLYPVNKNINSGLSVDERNNEDINKMNTNIKKLCKDKEVTYINVHDLLVDDEGNLKEEFTNDGLHLRTAGYKVVTDEIMKILK